MQMISCNNNMTPLSPTETGSYLLPLSGKNQQPTLFTKFVAFGWYVLRHN